MRFRTGAWLSATLLAFAAAGALAPSAVASTSPVVGHLYVNDNTAPQNTIAAFDRHADGTLTPVPGSPFPAGGMGDSAAPASQGSLQEALDGKFLLAVDPGSNQISVMRIGVLGRLQPVSRGVVSSGGSEPISIAVFNHVVYVANAGPTHSNYTGFTISNIGRLRPIAGSTFPLPSKAEPGDILFNKDGALLAGTRVGTSQIDTFAVGKGHLLTPAPNSPISDSVAGPFGSEFSPTVPGRLYVSNAHGGPGDGSVWAFNVASDGTLKAIGGAPVPDDQTAPCWVEISHDGRYLFTVNTAVATISSYAIDTNGGLTLLGTTAMKDATGLGPVDARLSPDGTTLWVVDSNGFVSGFSVSGGSLTELTSSPTAPPTGSSPRGIVVN